MVFTIIKKNQLQLNTKTMFDFSTIQFNSENPTAITILFTVMCSFILSSLVAFTYEKTSRDVSAPSHFIQALVLISIVAAMVMQAIGDSLARGLGMLGALAIIRFRTTIKSPRNIVFMFASIATGIACGVYGVTIAIVGTLSFCLVAVILRFTPFSQASNLIGILTFEMPNDAEADEVKQTLKQYCQKYLLKNYTVVTSGKKDGRIQYEYQIKLPGSENGVNLVKELQGMDNVKAVRLEFRDMDLGI
jgi:uncharacterized membrane protein YhiD involved in acid resistance